MDAELNQQVEKRLSRIKPSLGGADVRLKDLVEGVLTLEYFRRLSNPSACHVDRTPITKKIIIEILEDDLKKIIPDLKKIILDGEE